jgi:hypothetical protein
MREDIAKILVTRPRLGSSEKNSEVKKSRQLAREKKWEDLPKHSSMKPKQVLRHRPERRQLNEYLNPLIQYLHKNCGRSWNKIHSDICHLMDRRNPVQQHIFTHLFGFVETNPQYIDGKVYSSPLYGSYQLRNNGITFYVDKSGILRKPNARRPEWKENISPNLRRTNNKNIIYYCRDGTWFEVHLETGSDPFTYSHWDMTYYDKLLQRRVHFQKDWRELSRAYGQGNVYAARMRTLSKKEKKALKL